jgi:hypothetical protein
VLQQWISMKYAAKALILGVLHTFGGDLKFNAHVHVLISRGGFQESTGRWIAELHLNRSALMKMWRYAVIDHLRRALKARVLKSQLNVGDLRRLLSSAYYSESHACWIVLFDEIVSKAHFLGYAARYLRRPPIAKWRILKVTDAKVQFVAKDSKNDSQIPTWCTLDRSLFWTAGSPHKEPTLRWHILPVGTADSTPSPAIELARIAEEILWFRSNDRQLGSGNALGLDRLDSPRFHYPTERLPLSPGFSYHTATPDCSVK